MGIMRWMFYNRPKEIYIPLGITVRHTFGYITKNTRINAGLPKEHRIDALCIAGHPDATPVTEWYMQKKVRCHNRQLHKCTIGKGGVRKLNQAPKYVKGYQLFDVVKAKNRLWYIHCRRTKGAFVLKNLLGETLEIAPGKIRYICSQNNYIKERRRLGSA